MHPLLATGGSAGLGRDLPLPLPPSTGQEPTRGQVPPLHSFHRSLDLGQ